MAAAAATSAAVATRRRKVLRLHQAGHTQREIAELIGKARSVVALDLSSSPEYRPRLTLSTFNPGPGRISAKEASERHGLKLRTLCDAIDRGIVRGVVVELGQRRFRHVDPDEFAEDLRTLPQCGHIGCTKPALGPGGGCSGAHARAIATRGEWWDSEEGHEFVQFYEAAQIQAECWICHEQLTDVALAFVARAWRRKRRLVCASCEAIWKPCLLRARWAIVDADPDNPLTKRNVAATRAALEVGREFERVLRAALPGRRGKPAKWATILTAEALFAHGFGDDGAQLVLDRATGSTHAWRYITVLRQRWGIRRRGQGFRPAGILMH
jgi:hypothetical protein